MLHFLKSTFLVFAVIKPGPNKILYRCSKSWLGPSVSPNRYIGYIGSDNTQLPANYYLRLNTVSTPKSINKICFQIIEKFWIINLWWFFFFCLHRNTIQHVTIAVIDFCISWQHISWTYLQLETSKYIHFVKRERISSNFTFWKFNRLI